MEWKGFETEEEWREALRKEQADLLAFCVSWLTRLNKDLIDLTEAKSDMPDEAKVGAYNFAQGLEMAADILTIVQNNAGKGREEMSELIEKALSDYFQNKNDRVD